MNDAATPSLRPMKIAHFGIQTYNLNQIRDWYCAVLNGRVVYEKLGFFTTITFDDEHHRVAIIALPGKPRRKFRANPELAHVALEMADLESMLLNWERLKDLDITPFASMNHGATLSLYYFDPDGNQCEFFVDCFPTKKECADWFYSPYYQHNFGGGTAFNPEEMLAGLRSGTPIADLMEYPAEEGMKVDVQALIKQYDGAMQAEVESFVEEVRQEVAGAGA